MHTNSACIQVGPFCQSPALCVSSTSPTASGSSLNLFHRLTGQLTQQSNPIFQSVLKRDFQKCSAPAIEELCQTFQPSLKLFSFGEFPKFLIYRELLVFLTHQWKTRQGHCGVDLSASDNSWVTQQQENEAVPGRVMDQQDAGNDREEISITSFQGTDSLYSTYFSSTTQRINFRSVVQIVGWKKEEQLLGRTDAEQGSTRAQQGRNGQWGTSTCSSFIASTALGETHYQRKHLQHHLGFLKYTT